MVEKQEGAGNVPNAEDVVDAAPFGAIIWHSSGEDEGPDVGVALKLGADRMLWCGEISRSRFEETEGAEDLGGDCGWWIILYDGPDTFVLGKCPNSYEVMDAFDRLSAILRAPQEGCADALTGCADDQTFAGISATDLRAAAASAMSAGTAETAQQAQGRSPASATAEGRDAQPSTLSRLTKE